MNYGERVYCIRKALGLTLEKFGNPLGVTKTTISRIEKNERAITDQMAKSICREYGVSEEWLRNGTGEMFVPMNRDEQISKFAGELLKEDDSFKKRLIEALSKLDENEWELLEKIAKKLAKRTRHIT